LYEDTQIKTIVQVLMGFSGAYSEPLGLLEVPLLVYYTK